jgi:peptidoglycan glycosyltransferase
VLTAAAAIDSGRYTPNSTINGDSPKRVSGVDLQNDFNQSFGDITLTQALTQSVNTVFAQVGVRLGRDTMTQYMKRFGFYSKPQLDYPDNQMVSSGERDPRTGKLLLPTSPQVDLGRMAIGQDKLAVTPLQMAEVVAAVANGGKLMKPHLTDRIVDPDGRTVTTIAPSEQSQAIKPATATALNQMMRNVVEEGTGTAVQLPGVSVAGKTGTAQKGSPGSNITQPWFVAFAPADNPQIAIAVTVEKSAGGFGGSVAAPIARQVLLSLLHP